MGKKLSVGDMVSKTKSALGMKSLPKSKTGPGAEDFGSAMKHLKEHHRPGGVHKTAKHKFGA